MALAPLVLGVVVMATVASAAILRVDNSISSSHVDVAVSSRLKRSPTLAPDQQLDITFDVDGVPVTKSLELTATHQDVDLYLIDGEDIRPHVGGVKNKWATYAASDGKAAMLVKEHPEHGVRLEGSLLHNEAEYFIQPADNAKHHVLHRINEKIETDPHIEKLPAHIQEDIREKRADGNTYEIELLIIMDQSFYKLWEHVTPPGGDTIELMREHYGLLINEMDIRFQSLKRNYKLDLRVVMGGLIIDKDGKRDLFRRYKTETARTTYPPTGILSQFNKWANKHLPGVDAIQLHIGLHMNYNILGYAWIEGLCTPMHVGVIANHLNYRAVHTSSHELGHSMNMEHDGPSRCGQKYIMWPIMMQLVTQSEEPLNSWVFSYCSYSDAKGWISKLNRNKTNCMLKRTAKHTLSKYGKTMPGAHMNYEQQCNQTSTVGPFCPVGEPLLCF